MKVRSGLSLGGVLLLAGTLAFALATEPIGNVGDRAPIVFVCRNGVAMSVWSAAYFNRLAAARGLTDRAVSRASLPNFRAVPISMALALAADGFRLGGYRPHVIVPEDVRDAALVVAIDTELPPDVLASAQRTEIWRGFPPMREQYLPSRAALKLRVEALIELLARDGRADIPTASRGRAE